MGIESEYIGNINNHNFKIILDEMIQNRVDTYVASEEDLKIAYDILRIYDINQKETTKAIDKNAYDDNKRKLRTGNLIELTLDYDEGISDSMIIKCLQLAKKSKKEATKNFSSYQDSGF